MEANTGFLFDFPCNLLLSWNCISLMRVSNLLILRNILVAHCFRLHAQALTLVALGGSALVEYYDHQSGDKAKRYEKHVQ